METLAVTRVVLEAVAWLGTAAAGITALGVIAKWAPIRKVWRWISSGRDAERLDAHRTIVREVVAESVLPAIHDVRTDLTTHMAAEEQQRGELIASVNAMERTMGDHIKWHMEKQ